MRINSFVMQSQKLTSIEVEVGLVRGLPQIQILGLPDQAIRESVYRIKSAIKTMGYELPKAQQVIINLKPSHIKKSSRGIEFAIASGILWATEQVPKPLNPENLFLYGELGLSGEVTEPEDIDFLPEVPGSILTGKRRKGRIQTQTYLRVKDLQSLSQPEFVEPDKEGVGVFNRPQHLQHYFFTDFQSKLISLCAHGGHSALLAGPAGSGKTLAMDAIHTLLPEPNHMELKALRGVSYRPFVRPHPSTTMQGIIGGGQQVHSGEILRADGGILALDELLEFKPAVVESLREPAESGKVRIARAQGYLEYESKFQLLATTNLCPCGDFIPKQPVSCRYSLTRCRSYAQKLSGPMVDRFQVLSFSHKWRGSRNRSWLSMLEGIEHAQRLQRNRDQQAPNSRLGEEELNLKSWPSLLRELISSFNWSHRRRLSTLRVTRSVADLEGSEIPKIEHFEEALNYSFKPFDELKRWD